MLPVPEHDWWRHVSHASITFYGHNGEASAISLSETQTIALILLLGIDFTSPSESTAYSDDTIQRFMAMRGNPFQLNTSSSSESDKKDKNA